MPTKDVKQSKETKDTKNVESFAKLKLTYDNPKLMTKNVEDLAQRAGTTQASAKRYLDSLASTQVSKQVAPASKLLYVPTFGPTGRYLADTIYLRDYAKVNNNYGAIFTLIAANSRYSYSRPIVMNPGSRSRGVSAAKTAEAMISILEENARDSKTHPFKKITSLVSDGGAENQKELAALLRARNIEHIKLESYTHERLARLDRFHGSLRMLIGQKFAAENNHVWYPFFDALMENYNTRRHDSLSRALFRSASPASVSADEETFLQRQDAKKTAAIREQVPAWAPVTNVRLRYSYTNKGAKEEVRKKSNDQTYTSEVYQVVKRAGPNSYEINTDGLDRRVWPYHALQVVAAGTVVQPVASKTVNRKVVTAKRMEAQSISGEEKKGLALQYKRRPTMTTRSMKKN